MPNVRNRTYKKKRFMSNYRELLKDPRWQKKRLEVLQRDEFTCQCCPDNTSTLHVHHAKYFPGMPWECPNEYLITLCESCHEAEERMKSENIYEYVSDCRLTRLQLVVLLEHLRYSIKERESQGIRPFDSLHDVLEALVPPDKIFEYARWKRDNRK
jgi:hypothetical protein